MLLSLSPRRPTAPRRGRLRAAGVVAATALASLATPALAQGARSGPKTLTVINTRSVPLNTLALVAADGTTVLAQMKGPLAPGKSARLTANRDAPCEVSVQGTYADDSEVDVPGFNICRQRTARLTE